MVNRIGDYTWEATPEEIAAMQAADEAAERDFWQSVSYDEAVDAEIKKRYTISNELSILRQRSEKPEEYTEYYNYCEACKDFVREKRRMYCGVC